MRSVLNNTQACFGGSGPSICNVDTIIVMEIVVSIAVPEVASIPQLD